MAAQEQTIAEPHEQAHAEGADWVLLVVEEMAGTVSFYRASDGKRLGSVEAGLLPHEVRVTRDGTTAFASAFGLHDYDSPLGRPGTMVLEIDVPSMTVRRRLRTAAPGTPMTTSNRAPHGVELSPDERTLYVNCEHADRDRGVAPSILAYDLTAPSSAAYKTIPIGGIAADHGCAPVAQVAIDHRCALAHHLVASPDGRVLWMMAASQGLGAIDVATGKAISDDAILAPPHGAEALRGLCWTSAGTMPATVHNADDTQGDHSHGNPCATTTAAQATQMLLLASGRDTLATVDPTVPAWVNVWRGFGVGQLLYSTSTPDGALLLGPAVWNGLVIIVDAWTGALVRRVPTGLAPIHVLTTPDGRRAYVTNAYEAFVTEIDLCSFIVRRIATHGGPNGLAVLPASAVPAATFVPPCASTGVATVPDLVLRVTMAVDMSGEAVPGRRHDVGCETLAGASTWARSISGDGGLLHLPRGPHWRHADGNAVVTAVVVDYADLASDPSGETLAEVVRHGAPYAVRLDSGGKAREIHVVVARGVGDTSAAVAQARECGGSVLLVVLDSAMRAGTMRRIRRWAWTVAADASPPIDGAYMAHDRWTSIADFEDAYWNKFHERPAPAATTGAAAVCCLIEAALVRAASAVGAAVGATDLADALALASVHHGFAGPLAAAL
ncbi:YncE incomplete domain containing protein [Pandoravirus salinus]|uniref:YncE incomplete domain containing protein n=1 Tax=Pandoravirus salinus TaxID=1349410 RepID=S4W047_9VIRU|nr:YncE incomplete domain [Pandoravirus salinus]AGO83727.1 YncE incomplete domain containing protein [Pandoravirus salinus]